MTVVCLPGDGIGPEVMGEALRVLDELGIEHDEHAFGGGAILAGGDPLPPETLAACLGADAILLGAVGLPELEGKPVRPEQGLLRIRSELGVFANLRPALADGVDLLVVRELVGGLYYGARGTRDDGTVFDTLEYRPEQVERVARTAFELARTRRRKVTSVDKVNVLATSRLWRDVVTRVAAGYPDVPLDHALVDSFAMTIVSAPQTIDVILTENMFGDILSDVAAGVTGGLGLAASASLGEDGTPGIFEPVHGSAPDIAGRGVANPTGMLRSLALALELGLGRAEDARRLERALEAALASAPTPDLGGSASTSEFGDAVLAALA